MRRVFLIVTVLLAALWANPVFAQTAPTYSTIVASDADVTLNTLSYGSLPTVGCLNVVFIGSSSGDTGTTLTINAGALTDNQGNTYTKQSFTSGSSSFNTAVFTAPIVTSTGTFTVDIDGSLDTVSGWAAMAAICDQAASFLDITAEFENGGPGTSITLNFGSTTFSHDLIIAACGISGGSTISVPTGGGLTWNTIAENESDSRSFVLSYATTSATNSTYDPVWTLGTSRFWDCQGIAIKGAAGGGGGTAAPRLLLLGVGSAQGVPE